MSTEIQKTESKSPAELIAAAVSSNTDLDKLEKLLVLQERWEASQAKKAYHKAMAEFKANPPEIEKDKTVAYGNTKYNHASLANVTDKINCALSKFGLSAAWTTKQEGGLISVTCRITHVMGHSEETTLSSNSDTSGAKNAIQAIGSAITYLQRYTLLSLTGLATHEADDDGQATEKWGMSEDEAATLSDWLVAANVTEASLCKYLKIASVKDITKELYTKAITELKAKVAKK